MVTYVQRGDLPGRWRVVVLLSGAVSVWQVWAAKRVGMTRAAVSSDPIAGYASTASGEETGQEPVLGRDSNEACKLLEDSPTCGQADQTIASVSRGSHDSGTSISWIIHRHLQPDSTARIA